MTITVTPSASATQRAMWTYDATEGRYSAAVTRTSQTDESGRTGWVWELGFLPREGVGFHYTGPLSEDLIFTHDTDPARMLRTLAGFVSAWDEAQRYPESENLGLFPAACEPFLGASEIFDLDASEDV